MTYFNYMKLTDEGIVGYYDEGNSYATISDLNEFLAELHKKLEVATELKFLLEEYGENILVAWKKNFDILTYVQIKILYAKQYEENPKIQGTIYKECFHKFEELEKELVFMEKICSIIPTRVLKYFEENK